MAIAQWVLLIPGTGKRETGNGKRERESGNECTAEIRKRIQNGGITEKGLGTNFEHSIMSVDYGISFSRM